MPFVRAVTGRDTLLLNFDTGATEWLTMPLVWKDRLLWDDIPRPGPTVTNNQTGETRVLVARLASPLRVGVFEIERPLVYLNADADEGWLGSGLLRHFTLVFDPRHQRVRLVSAWGDTVRVPE
jgi:hypothetical protein